MIETIEAKLGYGKCPDEPAALMLTSGSTGNAKAVVLEHAQILASIQGKTKTLATGHKDVFFNWIGMFVFYIPILKVPIEALMLTLACEIGFDHVACLLESHLQALFHGSNQVHMSSTELLQDPIRLLEVIEEQKVTITFAPNFFIAMVLRACKNSDKDWNVDLSSLRHVVSGGEANVTILSAEVTKSIEQLGGSGDGILRTAFGMTEVSSSVYWMQM
jgi:acyl-CoA synthetase (AMP-forming)/AMP-acid ligase II